MAHHDTMGRMEALKLMKTYHGSVDDFFKFWPLDKTYFFSSDTKAFLAYRVYDKVAACLGDPVGRKSSIELLLTEFKAFCAQHGWLRLFIQTDSRYHDLYIRMDMHPVLIGSDAVIDLDEFFERTVRNKYFRNIVNRFNKHDFKVVASKPPHSKNLLGEVRAVSDSWLDIPHRKEWSFLSGRVDDEYLQQVPLFVLKDSSGAAQAFINQLPSYERGAATIDLMRHRNKSPSNSIDYLLVWFMEKMYADGYRRFNLGLSPIDSNRQQRAKLAKLLHVVYELSEKFINFQGLHQFKAKYHPTWEPRYIWYEGPAYHLPRFGYVMFRLTR